MEKKKYFIKGSTLLPGGRLKIIYATPNDGDFYIVHSEPRPTKRKTVRSKSLK